jgi:hypothetical protein
LFSIMSRRQTKLISPAINPGVLWLFIPKLSSAHVPSVLFVLSQS